MEREVDLIDVNKDNVEIITQALHASAMHAMGQGLELTREQGEFIFLSLALGGEAGEQANEAKKLWREGFAPDHPSWDKFDLELADVYAYLKHLAKLRGKDLDSVLADKASIILNGRRPAWAQEAARIALADIPTLMTPPEGYVAHDPRIIAFTGPKECGKDTMAQVLFRQNLGKALGADKTFQRQPFAYGVKAICEMTFGWSMEEQDDAEFKETPLLEWPSIEPRWAMMDIANFMRDKYGPDVWVHALRRRLDKDLSSQHPAGAYVITDLRFPNEIEYLKKKDALIIYVERDEAEEKLAKAKAAGDAKALNPSEAYYDLMKAEADIVLDNNRDIHKAHADVLSAVRTKFGFWGYWQKLAFHAHARKED
jgi:NTP pyrophosphatase (non-canonical NTP hydrolase)